MWTLLLLVYVKLSSQFFYFIAQFTWLMKFYFISFICKQWSKEILLAVLLA